MKILVIGGLHGNEPLGIELVKLIKLKPIKNVESEFGNEIAIRLNRRFGELDFDECFPGKKGSKVYEYKQAARLVSLSKKYDLVLDFHNTYSTNNDCGILDTNANKELLNINEYLGLKRIIFGEYICLNKFVLNSLSVEISLDSELNNAKFWYKKITKLSRLDKVICDKSKSKKFKFVYWLSKDEREKLNIIENELMAFKRIKKSSVKFLGINSKLYPIFVDNKYVQSNYGALLIKIDK